MPAISAWLSLLFSGARTPRTRVLGYSRCLEGEQDRSRHHLRLGLLRVTALGSVHYSVRRRRLSIQIATAMTSTTGMSHQ